MPYWAVFLTGVVTGAIAATVVLVIWAIWPEGN